MNEHTTFVFFSFSQHWQISLIDILLLSDTKSTSIIKEFSVDGGTCIPRKMDGTTHHARNPLCDVYRPFLVHLSRRPSSVRRPSVRPSSLTFHIFDFFSETTDWNLTKLYMKVDLNVLYQVCVFRVDRKNKMAALPSNWLRHFRLLWNRRREFNETWQEARSQRPLPSLCFSGRSEKQDGRPGLWLAETFSTSPLKPLNRIQRNLTGSKISTSSTKFVFFGPIGKNKMAVLAFDWLRHFRLLLWNRWTEFNETWQEARSQRPLPSLCFSGRSEKQYGCPGLSFAETFSTSPLKPLNWIQRNLTGSKISTSSTKFVFFGLIGKTRWRPCPLIGWNIFDFSETAVGTSTKLDRKQDLNVLYQVCVFSGRSEKQDGRPGLWLVETFSTSPLKPLNRIQRNLTGSKISASSTKFVLFGSIGKTRWPPWPLIGWDIFDFSSETAERNSTKLDRKQDLSILYQVCVFRADRKNKMAALASDWLRHFRLLLWNRWTEFNETWQEARSQRPLQVCVFRADRKNKMAAWPLIGWYIFDFSSETTERNSTKLDRKQDLSIFYQVCVFRADRKNKMAALASDWLRNFLLLIWNCWTEFNETWQKARSQRPLPSLCFLGRSEKQDGRPGQSAKKVAHCTQVHDMWPFGPLVLGYISIHRKIVRVITYHLI